MTKQIETLVVSFLKFKDKSGLITSAYKTKIPAGNSLHYSIVLKEDNHVNRQSLMEFFEVYLTLGIDHKFPVTFQFVPENLISKINTLEKIV